jgi:endo-1,4-beta-xylanase
MSRCMCVALRPLRRWALVVAATTCIVACDKDLGSARAAAIGTATLSIEGGATWTRSTNVNLTIAPVGWTPTSMCISNTSRCTSFVPFAASKPWTLSGTVGTKTVNATLRDSTGSTAAISASIYLDNQPPSPVVAKLVRQSTSINVSWTGSADTGMGLSGYQVWATDVAGADPCTTGAAAYLGPDTSFSHDNLDPTRPYAYCVHAVDNAGNKGRPTVVRAPVSPEYDPPLGTAISLNAGAALTNSRTVTLDLSASDASGPFSMCVSNSASCNQWKPFAASSKWALAGTDGTATVRVWFKDQFGNTTRLPLTASIILDTTVTDVPSMTATSMQTGVDLTWGPAADANGVTHYTLVWQPGTIPPASCATGPIAYQGLGLGYVDTAMPSGPHSYRLCVVDSAGNTSKGLIRTATVPSDQIKTAAQAAGIYAGAAVNHGALTTDPEYAAIIAAEFDVVTPEYGMKWKSLEPIRDQWNFGPMDAVVATAAAAGQRVKGHTLIWHHEVPTWAASLPPADLLDAIHAHIRATVGHFRGSVFAWDVVNEAIDDKTLTLRPGIHSALGVAGLAQVYKWVEEEDPNALLIYNDYGIEGAGAKTEAVRALLSELMAQGARIDAVGMQAHLDTAAYPSELSLRHAIQRFSELGLRVTYSELDVRTRTADASGPITRRGQAQALVYRLVAAVCATEPACLGITLWGFTDKVTSIKNDDPLVYDAKYAPKPAYSALIAGLQRLSPTSTSTKIVNGNFEANSTGTPWSAAGATLTIRPVFALTGNGATISGRTQTYHGVGQTIAGGLRSGDTVCSAAWVRVDSPRDSVSILLRTGSGSTTRYISLANTVPAQDAWSLVSSCRVFFGANTATDSFLSVVGPRVGTTFCVDDVALWTLVP